VVGASRTEWKSGYRVLANILEAGYAGALYPVNPGVETILGVPTYPDLASIPETPELVIAVLPRTQTRSLMLDCADAGVRHVIIPAAGSPTPEKKDGGWRRA